MQWDIATTEAFLDTSEYLTWHCEAMPTPAPSNSGHDANRVCVNELLWSTTASDEFPIGAAAVKELFNGQGELAGYSFIYKGGPTEEGYGWWWYEVLGPVKFGAAYGDANCIGCHATAEHDFVFTVVP